MITLIWDIKPQKNEEMPKGKGQCLDSELLAGRFTLGEIQPRGGVCDEWKWAFKWKWMGNFVQTPPQRAFPGGTHSSWGHPVPTAPLAPRLSRWLGVHSRQRSPSVPALPAAPSQTAPLPPAAPPPWPFQTWWVKRTQRSGSRETPGPDLYLEDTKQKSRWNNDKTAENSTVETLQLLSRALVKGQLFPGLKKRLSQQFINQIKIVKWAFPRGKSCKEIIPFQENLSLGSLSPQEHGWAHLHPLEQISCSHFPAALFHLDFAGCWQECHAALWASAAPLLHAPLCREGRTNTSFQSRWCAGESRLWRAIFELEKGCWGKKNQLFFLSLQLWLTLQGLTEAVGSLFCCSPSSQFLPSEL